ncbi:MAG: alpha-2-macroglobulin family protein, partial [Candidatus Peribacteraceae bacterium]|nr:alpha-2-macroglobulin family protein [Candidatus Peribacteraceae bacterium]
YYSISAGLPDSPYQEIYGSFQVLAYRKPEYRVDVATEREDFFNGETVQAQIDGSYYFGAPLSGAKVDWRVMNTDYYFNRFTDGWYSFATEDAWCWWECQRETEVLAQGSGKLDAAGHLAISFPATIDDQPVSQVFTIEADVTDPNNQVVSNRTEVAVHKANVYVGVRTEDYMVTPGQSAKIGVVTVAPSGDPLPKTSITLGLYRRTWNAIRKKGVDGEYYYENTPEDTFLKYFSAKTDEKGKATVAVPITEGGQFVVTATAKDDRGREAKASTSVYAWSSTYINWPHANNDRIDLLPDKPEYTIGETATFLLKSPFQGTGVKALVTVEREQVIKRWVIDVESTAQKITLPITEDLLPDAYVSAVVIKPRMGETFDANGLDTGAPAFRIGYARITVETSKKEMTVSLETDKEKYLPGEQVQVTLKTTDWEGKPVPAELSLGVVDMSLLALTGFARPNLTEAFYGNRWLGIRTAEMLKFLIDRYKPGSKGGGGGLEEKPRGDFKDTAYWNPVILTNEKGEASLTFTLPDNLTTWQLLAIGQTKTSTFGAMDDTIIETKHVILRPVRPRFAVVGDRVELGAIVHNFTESAQTFSVTLTGSGFDAVSSGTQKVTIQPDQMQKLLFPVTIRRTEKAVLHFTAVAEDGRDEITETIPVFPYGTPQSAATTGSTEDKALEKVLVPSKADARDGTLTLTLSPSLATYLPKGLEYLSKFPYGCAEQTLSAMLPQIALLKLQGFDAFRIVDEKTLRNQVTTGLQRLSAFQRSDGGFGYWESGDRSYPALSAYVLAAFTMMRDSGFAVDGSAINRVRGYLDQTLRTNDPNLPLDAATRAVILFALSESGGADISLLKNLDAQRDKLPLFAKAMLAMSFRRAGNAAKAQDLLTDIQNRALVEGRGTHFEEEDVGMYDALMNTNQRTTALVLMAMLRIDPSNALAPNIVRYLLSVRQDGHWDTTQSTAYALLALTDYLKATGEMNAAFTAGVKVNDEVLLDWNVTKTNALSRKEISLSLDDLTRGAENAVTIVKDGTGRLYYDLLLSYFYTADTLPPAEEGIGITRVMEPLPGQASAVTVGNTYRVTLTITVPEDRHFVAVSSPLPAGLEPIDLSLETAQKTLLSDSTTNTWNRGYWQSGLWRFNHHEFRDDSVFLFADELPAGVYQWTYLVRATTPGVFHERPALAWQMYFPEVFGQTEGKLMTIRE